MTNARIANEISNENDLYKIDIIFESFLDQDFIKILEALRMHKNLQRLELDLTSTKNPDFMALLALLGSFDKVKKFKLIVNQRNALLEATTFPLIEQLNPPPALENLKIDFGNTTISSTEQLIIYLSKIKTLKKLKIGCWKTQVTSLGNFSMLSNLTNLEFLELDFFGSQLQSIEGLDGVLIALENLLTLRLYLWQRSDKKNIIYRHSKQINSIGCLLMTLSKMKRLKNLKIYLVGTQLPQHLQQNFLDLESLTSALFRN